MGETQSRQSGGNEQVMKAEWEGEKMNEVEIKGEI